MAASRPGAQAPSATASGSRTPWLVAGIIIILFLAFMVARLMPGKQTPQRADMANVGNAPPGGATPEGPGGAPGGGAPPDISAMTPEERFVRLSDRLLSAAASGDSATATTFAPMALAAYGMLPDADAALRYRAARIHARTGDYPAALALADTILAVAPDHLLGLVARGEVAKMQGDSARLTAVQHAFDAAYEKEIARQDRPEYQEFRADLDGFRGSSGR
jgi:hypothetical protein